MSSTLSHILTVVLHLINYIFIFIIHFIPYILYQDPHEDETMPAWPPLILDQSNNLLVMMAITIAPLINAVVMYPPQKCKPDELSLKVANETSGVRRLTVPTGQTVTLYCPKTSFENYQGPWERLSLTYIKFGTNVFLTDFSRWRVQDVLKMMIMFRRVQKY